MILRYFACCLAAVVVVVVVAFTNCASAGPQDESISITDERPVAKAAETLEHRFGIPVTYEDTIYFNKNDYSDITAIVRGNDTNPTDPEDRIFVPRRRTITFLAPTTSQKGKGASLTAFLSQTSGAVDNVLKAFTVASGEKPFRTIRDSSGIHIVPQGFTDTEGLFEAFRSPLDTSISLSSDSRSALEIAEEMCRLISVGQQRVVELGQVPINLLGSHQVQLTVSDHKARTYLEALSKAIGTPLSWDLFCDPGDEGCALNIHVVQTH